MLADKMWLSQPPIFSQPRFGGYNFVTFACNNQIWCQQKRSQRDPPQSTRVPQNTPEHSKSMPCLCQPCPYSCPILFVSTQHRHKLKLKLELHQNYDISGDPFKPSKQGRSQDQKIGEASVSHSSKVESLCQIRVGGNTDQARSQRNFKKRRTALRGQ